MLRITEFIESNNVDAFDEMNIGVQWDIWNDPVNEELCKARGKLKDKKSFGTPSEFYKYGGKTMNRLLIALYNRILDSGDYSVLWCEGDT